MMSDPRRQVRQPQRRRRRRQALSDRAIFARVIGRVAFFPFLFVYLELILHIAMDMSLAYVPIYILFALSMGCAFSAITMPFRRNVNRVLAKVLAVLVSVIYIVEMIAKKIIQNLSKQTN